MIDICFLQGEMCLKEVKFSKAGKSERMALQYKIDRAKGFLTTYPIMLAILILGSSPG